MAITTLKSSLYGYYMVVILLIILTTLVDLISSGGYSCYCDCGPNAGGGRCFLQLPSIEYLNSGGTCQAIKLDTTRHQCVKNVATEDESNDVMCWSMPRTACMCREPTGNYNLMCECDGNRGIFCGSEQNNCVCELYEADRNVALTIGIAVGATVIGIFIITFIITAIYFIRKAQLERDPWYQFDKQFKSYMARKEREKASGIRRPPRKRVIEQPAPQLPVRNPSPSTVDDVITNLDPIASTKQPLMLTPPAAAGENDNINERRRKLSDTSGPNWLLQAKMLSEQQAELMEMQIQEENPSTLEAAAASSSTDEALPLTSKPSTSTAAAAAEVQLNSYSTNPVLSENIYSSSIMERSSSSTSGSSCHKGAHVAPWSDSLDIDAVVVHQAASSYHDNFNIYDTID